MRAARIVSTGRGLALLLALVACATTVQTRSIQPSGFLGDYAQLEEGRGGETGPFSSTSIRTPTSRATGACSSIR